MDSIIKAGTIYFALLIIFRIAGKRTLSQITTFDFVLLLVIGEATQQALLGNDFSITNAITVIVTLVVLNIIFSIVKQRWKKIDLFAEGTPILLIKNGLRQNKSMKRERVDESDIMNVARKYHGLEDISQIKHAVLEKTGGITVIPFRESTPTKKKG